MEAFDDGRKVFDIDVIEAEFIDLEGGKRLEGGVFVDPLLVLKRSEIANPLIEAVGDARGPPRTGGQKDFGILIDRHPQNMPSEASLGDFFVILVCPKTEKKALSSRQKGYVTIKKID